MFSSKTKSNPHLSSPIQESGQLKDIFIATTAEELSPFEGEWDDLAQNSSERNPFYGKEILIPALEEIKTTESVKVVLIWDRIEDARVLIGVIPLAKKFGYRGFPVNYLCSWEHIHCFLCTPLVRKNFERKFFRKLFDWINTDPAAETLVELRLFNADGPICKALEDYIAITDTKFDLISEEPRAMLFEQADFDSYFENNFNRKQRKELNRKKRRLAEHGEVAFEVLGNPGKLDEWIECFLALEDQSWKGNVGTSLLSNPAETEFFNKVLRLANKKNQLHLMRLKVGDRIAALNCCIQQNSRLYCFKIAHSSEFANCSPGALLMLEMIRYVIDHPDLDSIDSCTHPNSRLLNSMLPNRTAIRYMNIGTAHPLSNLLIKVVPPVRRFYHSVIRN